MIFRDTARASGRTTRLADNYIQQLFEYPGEWVRIKDHFTELRADQTLCDKIYCRVQREHGFDLETRRKGSALYLRVPETIVYSRGEFQTTIDKNNMNRITVTDNMNSALVKICEENPGAVNACCCLIKEGLTSPIQFHGLQYIMILDKLQIYGIDIYVLWSDICNRDTSKMIEALKIADQDELKADVLRDACHRQDYSGRQILQDDNMFKDIIR